MSSITDAQRIKELQETAYRKVFACFIREEFALVCVSSRATLSLLLSTAGERNDSGGAASSIANL